MAEDFGCSDCAKKKTFHINKALDEMTDEEWNQAFPTFAGKRANVFEGPCESCQ